MVRLSFKAPNAISKRLTPDPPIEPELAVNVTVDPGANSRMFAVVEVKFDADESVIDPAMAVIVMFVLVERALAPRSTLRPADSVNTPDDDVTVDAILISPAAVAEVNVIPSAELTDELMVNVFPAVSATAPKDELTAAPIVISLPAPVDVNVTVPAPPALTAPLTVIDPSEATVVILPVAFVVIALIVTFPVDAV